MIEAKEVTESVSQEHVGWAVKRLKECGCKIKAVIVDNTDKFTMHITYFFPTN